MCFIVVLNKTIGINGKEGEERKEALLLENHSAEGAVVCGQTEV
jgi:hypothetical protein